MISRFDNSPEGWAAARLPELVSSDGLFVDGDWVESKDQDPSGDVRLIQLADVGDGVYMSKSRRFLTSSSATRLGCTFLAKGDILIARMPDPLGRACIFPGDTKKAVTVVDVAIFRTGSDGVDQSWLAYAINAPQTREAIAALASGTTRSRVSRSNLATVGLPVAPVAEQRRIATKLDAIFAQTRAAKARLERLPALLEKLKRSILAAAFRGDLTKDWRAANPKVEPGNVLLDRIRTERRARWEAAELTKFKAKGRLPTDGRWKVKYVAPEQISSIAHLPSVPTGWQWARAEEVCDFITKGTTPASHRMHSGAGHVPFIKVYNLTLTGDLDFSVNPTFIDRTTHTGQLERSRVLPGDVLMNIVGPPLGKVSMVPYDHPEWNINQAIAVFRPVPGLLNEYLCLALLESGTLERAVRLAKTTAGQSNLTLEICRDIPLPLPSEAEQREIARRVQAALRRLDEIRKRVASNATCLAAFELGLLAKAFRGELVPQDPNDEPAAALLERIRAARAAEPTAPRWSRPAGADQPAPTAAVPTNGHAKARGDDPIDLVIAVFQRGEPRLRATQIAEATGLDAGAVKRALATLVDSRQIRVHGRARSTTYEWSP